MEEFLTLLKDTVKQISNTCKNYDPTKPSIYIPYLDLNNLHDCGKVIIFLIVALSG